MSRFVDPRSNPDPSAGRPSVRLTDDPEELEELRRLCREGRLYKVECWIAEVALKQQNHALTLLLLCNGYDLNREPRCALDTAFDLRRPDLVDLLLDWGADPHRFDRFKLFDTYDTRLFERFYHLGVAH
jgi:hypothetical protein